VYRRLGRSQCGYRRCWEKSLAPVGTRTPAVQPTTHRYTDWPNKIITTLVHKQHYSKTYEISSTHSHEDVWC
jgi:hypothetical protein